jgi:hypothetical protein
MLCGENAPAPLGLQAVPLPNLRDAHTPVRLPTHRDLVQPHSRIQAGAKSVPTPLVRTDARNVEVLTDFQPVNTLGNLGVLARLLNSRTKIGVSERDAVFVSTRGINDLAGRDGTVGVNPVPPSPTVGGGSIGDLFAITVSRCRRELSHREPRAGVTSLAGNCINVGARKADPRTFWLPGVVEVGWGVSEVKHSLCDQPSDSVWESPWSIGQATSLGNRELTTGCICSRHFLS